MSEATHLRAIVLEECQLMAGFALESGKPVPPDVVETIERAAQQPSEPNAVKKLAAAHGALSSIIAPATPRSLRYIQQTSGRGITGILRSIPFIRNLLGVTAVCLLIFIATSLTNEVRAETINKSYLELFGTELLLIEIFFLSAAGLGASFAALFQANRYLVQGTFDPRYIPSYVIRFALGLIAGIILAEIIPVNGGEMSSLTKPTLAMLGGFSASVVHKVLQRLLVAVETLVHGNEGETSGSKEAEARLAGQQQLAAHRLQTAVQLAHLQNQITADSDPEQIKQAIKALLADLLPETTTPLAADRQTPDPTAPSASYQGEPA